MSKPSRPEDGLTIQEAIARFSDAEMWSAYRAAGRKIPRLAPAIVGSLRHRELEQDRQLFKCLGWKLRHAFQDKLQRGELFAYGYSIPRSPDDARVPVPVDLWHDRAKISWENSSISADGLEFVSVRIYGPEKDRPVPVNLYRTGLSGRPSIKHLILGELERRVKARDLKPILAHEAKALREWAESTHPKAPTPAARAIENMIRDEYRKIVPLPQK